MSIAVITPRQLTATIVVCTSDAKETWRASWSTSLGRYLLCDGTADNVEIQAAIDALPAGGGEIAVLGDNLYFSTKVNIDLTGRKVSLRGQGTKITSNCAATVPCFEIFNNAATLSVAPILSGFVLEGQDASTGRRGIYFRDDLYVPTIENLWFLRFDKAIFLDVGASSQLEGLTGNNLHFDANNFAIYLNPNASPRDTCESRLTNINMIVPEDGVGLYIGNNMALGRSYLEMIAWLIGDDSTGIFNDGSLTASFLNYKCEAGMAYTGRKAIDIGTNAQAGHQAHCVFGNGMGTSAGEIWINDPFNKKLLFHDIGKPQLGLSSLIQADIEIPFTQDTANHGARGFDYSGYSKDLTLFNSPTWGTLGKLGSIAFNGTTQYGKSVGVPFNGDRYLVVVFKTDFASDVATDQYVAEWFLNANNYLRICYLATLDKWYLEVSGNGTAKGILNTTQSFATGTTFVLTTTIKASTGTIELFVNGISEGTASAIGTIPTTQGTLWIAAGNTLTLGAFQGYAFIGEGNYYLEAKEVRTLTKELAYLVGFNLVLENSGTATITKLAAPGAATAAEGTAGNVNIGAHSWKVTLVDDEGEETEAGAKSNVVTIADSTKIVNLSAVPTGATGTASRKIYRTVAGDAGDYKLVGTLAGNSVTTFEDNIADADLGAVVPATNGTGYARTVTHGLAVTPTRAQTTFTSDPGAANALWASNKGATTFKVNAKVQVTASTTFDWAARVGEG